jgi:hypothetical protein
MFWYETINDHEWSDDQKLNQSQIDKVDAFITESGIEDPGQLADDFTAYWEINYLKLPAKARARWVLYLRLRTWVRNASGGPHARSSRESERNTQRNTHSRMAGVRTGEWEVGDDPFAGGDD